MSQYNTERPFPLTHRPYHNHWPHYYNHSQLYHSPLWQNSPHIDHYLQPNTFPSLTDYPESSQRTILTSSPDNIQIENDPIYSYKNDQRRSQSSHSSDYAHSTLYAPGVDEFQYPGPDIHPEDTADASQCPESRQTSSSASISSPSSFHPSVKVEPEDTDGCFIMELSSISPGLSLNLTNQALSPPTEVPLRATQASKEMRKMMGVFRLNPFAMHTGEGRGVMPAPWSGGGPLEEEPLIFEFQLQVEDNSDSGDTTDHTDASGASGSRPTDLLGAEEEAQLRSFSPSFELHPEDLKSEMGEQEQEDGADQDQQNEWSEADYCNHSEVDTSSTTHSVHTPSESRSAHTPFNESQSAYRYPTPPPAASTWDIDSYQQLEKMDEEHKMHRLHTTTSHPYLRRNHLNHQVSPSSSTHSLSQPQPQLHFGYSVLQQPTHHPHQHYNQTHSQSYSQLPTFHGPMISAPLSNLELISVPSDRLEENSSYMRSGRALKPVADETSTLHHHPAGIVNEYTPRGSTSSACASQHDTHASGHPYEQSSSSGHVFAPSRRWSLPETIGHSGFRSPI